jgi:hypothetical protein
VNFADGKVTFRWKDYAHKNKKRLMTVTAEEFLRRFLLLTLPRGFVRIRFYGFLANRRPQNTVDALPEIARQPAAAASGDGRHICPNLPVGLAVPALWWWNGIHREAYGSTDPMEICWPGELP